MGKHGARRTPFISYLTLVRTLYGKVWGFNRNAAWVITPCRCHEVKAVSRRLASVILSTAIGYMEDQPEHIPRWSGAAGATDVLL